MTRSEYSTTPCIVDDITVRNLATHTLGLGGLMINPEVVATADAVKLAFSVKIAGKPGTRAQYDSFDFTLLQFILEEIAANRSRSF